MTLSVHIKNMQLYKYTSTKQELERQAVQISNMTKDPSTIDPDPTTLDPKSRSTIYTHAMIHSLYFWCQRHARLSGQLLNGLQWVAPRSGLLGIFYCWALTASITMSASWLLACILFSRPVPDKRQMRKKSCYRQVVVAPLAFSGIWKQLNWCGAMEPWCPPGQMSRPPRAA